MRAMNRSALATAAALACTVAFPTHADAQRRGAPGKPRGPLTTVAVALGKARYDARVDANCHVDERAARGNTRAYFVVMYPWFGQRPPADQPQWHLNLEIRRAARTGAYDQFTFSFVDGSRSGVIQTVAGSPRFAACCPKEPCRPRRVRRRRSLRRPSSRSRSSEQRHSSPCR